jgi:hypothetical protein
VASIHRHRSLGAAPAAAATALVLGLVWAAPTALAAQGTPPPSPAAAGAEQVVLTGRVVVGPNDSVGTVVIFDGPAIIAGRVHGDVVVFNGATDISGTVSGNVVAFNGPVFIRTGAEVDGDLVTRERPTIESGTTVRGNLQRIGSVQVGTGFSLLGRFLVWLAISISSLVLGLLLLLFAPRAADAVANAAGRRTGASIGWGLGLFFLLPLASVLAIATLLGIPLGFGILLALGLLYSIGYVASAHIVGRLIVKPPTSKYAAFLLGWVFLRALALVPVVGGLTWLLGSIFGLGAIAVAVRAASSRDDPGAGALPAPPAPVPEG